MGWPIYIYAWVSNGLGGYHDVEVYGGRNWFKAFNAARKAKRNGAGCVRLEWR